MVDQLSAAASSSFSSYYRTLLKSKKKKNRLPKEICRVLYYYCFNTWNVHVMRAPERGEKKIINMKKIPSLIQSLSTSPPPSSPVDTRRPAINFYGFPRCAVRVSRVPVQINNHFYTREEFSKTGPSSISITAIMPIRVDLQEIILFFFLIRKIPLPGQYTNGIFFFSSRFSILPSTDL